MFDWLKSYGVQIIAAFAFTGIGAVAHMSASAVKDAACAAPAHDMKPPALPAASPAPIEKPK